MDPTLARGLVWLRRDLRAHDHAALHLALSQCAQVHCVFVFDPHILDALPRRDRRVAFLQATLAELDATLRTLAGQAEAGLSVGLTHGQTLRIVQLPQALTAMLPALIGQTVVILKDSALGYAVTYLDLLNWSKTLGSAYGNTIPAYIVAAALFITMNNLLTQLAQWVERRLNRRHTTTAKVTSAVPAAPLGPPEGEELLHPHQVDGGPR